MSHRFNVAEKVAEFNACGYCTLPAYFDADACRRQAEIVERYWQSKGSPALEHFGFAIHPMLPATPDIAVFLNEAPLINVIREILQDEVHLVHVGARLSGEASQARIDWHHHYGGWDESALPRRKKTERLLFGTYVHGCTTEVGPLVVLPRKINDPIGAPPANISSAWPGEKEVTGPPGTVAIFDTALWHAAKRGTRPGRRLLWGTHAQGWSEQRKHPEDNACDTPETAAALQKFPVLRAMVRGK